MTKRELNYKVNMCIALRKAAGLTQEQFADLLKVNVKWVKDIEAGRGTLLGLSAFCAHFNLALYDIIGDWPKQTR